VKLLGFEITRLRQKDLMPPSSSRGWYPVVGDWYPGAWQQNNEIRVDSVLAYHAVFACVTLISQDVGKLRPKLVQKVGEVWPETESPAFSPVLRRPNHYQNHQQFKEWWVTSRLVRGNTYALKQRDNRGVVVALYLLDPSRVKPLVSTEGLVFYELSRDNLSNLQENVVIVPASEIIHDRMNCLYHPLMGLSPIYACGLASAQGLAIQNGSTDFFTNMSRPSGILTAPGAISDEAAVSIGNQWQANYSGLNSGRVAVLGDDLKYQPLSVTAEDSQLIEQLKMTAEIVCSCFHVPPFKIGMGPMPPTASLEVLNGIYYSDCLQSHIESWENSMDEGLGLGETETNGRLLGVELDLDQLLRMDQKTMIDMLAAGVTGAIFSPDEARQRVNLGQVKGGKSPYLQQQNFSLEALAERDANDPFSKPAAPPPAQTAPPAANDDEVKALTQRLVLLESRDPAADLADYVARELAHV
jgi:HK97 family phage portal protein